MAFVKGKIQNIETVVSSYDDKGRKPLEGPYFTFIFLSSWGRNSVNEFCFPGIIPLYTGDRIRAELIDDFSLYGYLVAKSIEKRVWGRMIGKYSYCDFRKYGRFLEYIPNFLGRLEEEQKRVSECVQSVSLV